jgi:murein L,D-transpeptidase YcbB/YkuD
MPRDLGDAYTMVNIPNYTLKVVHHGETVWSTKIVAGKPSTPTPLTSVPMQHIVVNPTWYVPPSIIYGEYLPALQQDPTVLQRMGLVLERSRDGSVSIRQPPGDGNALGRMKFAFPNKFLVYQHDTPQKYYFAHDKRAYSHGCMRVENPPKYGEVVLSIVMPDHHYTAERLRKMYGGGETYINLPKPYTYMVHLTYQTAFVDENGKLQMRDDVYGIDSRTLSALKEDHRVADLAVERARESHSSGNGVSSRRRAELNRAAERSLPTTGLSFFERLFR